MNDIKNIAVCLYGRFGTGEFCAPNTLEFFKNTKGVNVDFFCASKDYDNYYHTKYNRSRDDITKIDTEYLTDMLSMYNPKDTLIVEYEVDLRRGFESSGALLFNQICESIMLKSNYEVNNDMQYDVVFVTRYDVLFHPNMSTYLDHYIEWHNTEFINTKFDIFGNEGDSWMFTPRVDIRRKNTYAPKVAWNDIFFFGSSMTMDLVAANSLLLTNDQQFATNKKTHIYPDRNNRGGHEGLGLITRKSNIPVANYPCFDKHGNANGTWTGTPTRYTHSIGYTLVREFGDMINPYNSIEAFENNMVSWTTDKPFFQLLKS